jgi:hypothetical protein
MGLQLGLTAVELLREGIDQHVGHVFALKEKLETCCQQHVQDQHHNTYVCNCGGDVAHMHCQIEEAKCCLQADCEWMSGWVGRRGVEITNIKVLQRQTSYLQEARCQKSVPNFSQ